MARAAIVERRETTIKVRTSLGLARRVERDLVKEVENEWWEMVLWMAKRLTAMVTMAPEMVTIKNRLMEVRLRLVGELSVWIYEVSCWRKRG